MTTKKKTRPAGASYGYSVEDMRLNEENQVLRETIQRLNEEIQRLKSPALMVCEFQNKIGENQAIIKIPNGNRFLSFISSDCEELKQGDLVFVEQKNLNLVKRMPGAKKFNVEKFVIIEKPKIAWQQIGGLDHATKEIKEVIELPLKKPELFEKVGIQPPKGILLYGPPGTGKTLLAKAVARSTGATFIEVTGSELVQKFIGDGARLVKEIFELARHKSPSIIFIDEIDALASQRMEMGTSGEREVNRTFMQLLAEIDGFKNLGDVKVICATNRKDVLDPAILRPGRLDRQIYITEPDKKGRTEIFKIHTSSMKFDKKILKDLVEKTDGFTGAEIRAVCTEAGYFAIRKGRTTISKKDFEEAIEKVLMEEELEGGDYFGMYG